jgi:hypothetical protein
MAEGNMMAEQTPTYEEVIRQEYENCVFSAGIARGHPVDSLYLKLERNGETDLFVIVRPDEMLALAWCATGVLWSAEMSKLLESKEKNEQNRANGIDTNYG